jgi:hypothetical protein
MVEVGMLPTRTIRQLFNTCEQLAVPVTVVNHAPTFTAAETQAVLPQGCLVQKTITGRVADKLILWTGVGDFRVTRVLRKMANQKLGFTTKRDHNFNPVEIDPFLFYGVRPGMVSPFLIRDTPATSQLTALFALDWSSYSANTTSVAVSLSLTESLIMPVRELEGVLHTYARAVYSELPIFTLTEETDTLS